MQTKLLAALSAALLVAAMSIRPPCSADGVADPLLIDASFDTARLADELSGILGDPAKEVRVRTYVSKGSTLSATITSDPAEGVPIAGFNATLCDDAGNAVDVSAFDTIDPVTGAITWKKVPLPATGGYSIILRGTGAGIWHMKLSGVLATLRQTINSAVNLGVGAETSIDVAGLRGATLAYQLKPVGTSKFKGGLLRVERPDGSSIDDTPTAAKGRVRLDADGVHHLVFRNAGTGIGAWTAKTTVIPPAQISRRGYVLSTGTSLVPTVAKVTPGSGFRRDKAAAVTLTGRDFQPGCDVRLVRRGRQDILASDVIVDSETQIRCTFDLDTQPVNGTDSLGVWSVGVWNAPEYTAPGDRTTLVKDSKTFTVRAKFASISAASIHLPAGTIKKTEVWQLVFNADFQTDLDRMGLGSSDAATEEALRSAVEAYTVCFLRDLFHANETNGKLVKGETPAVSFVIGDVPLIAGTPGVDYNRLEIGGAWQTGDDRDVAEPLLWGFAPLDTGNTHRDDLSIDVAGGTGTTRVGHGLRTRVLDPGSGSANADWQTAMSPLRQNPVVASDRPLIASNFQPTSVSQANRYRDIVNQITRAGREIAALAAHHIGRAMGLPSNGSGPMSNPTTAGFQWPTIEGFAFDGTELATLRDNAVPHAMPGHGGNLIISYFPLISTQSSLLPNLTTAVAYSVAWNYVGGRPNARPADYTVKFSGNRPLDLVLSYQGLSGTARLYLDASQGLFYCNIQYFRVVVTDTVRGGIASFPYRLNVLPNIPMLRQGVEQINATNCRNTILSTP